jgi:hypothetical protein
LLDYNSDLGNEGPDVDSSQTRRYGSLKFKQIASSLAGRKMCELHGRVNFCALTEASGSIEDR